MEDNIIVNDNEHTLTYDADICDKLSCIIEEFNIFYLQHRSSVSLDIFDSFEKSLISQHTHIFLNYTAGKAVLVKWLLDEIYNYFCQQHLRKLDVNAIRHHLSGSFGADVSHAFCLESWLRETESITRKQFLYF